MAELPEAPETLLWAHLLPERWGGEEQGSGKIVSVLLFFSFTCTNVQQIVCSKGQN